MTFAFNDVSQEITVWALIEKGYTDEAYTNFRKALSGGRQVELNEGPVTVVAESDHSSYEENGFLVFSYEGETYRMDVEEDSWSGETVSAPYRVVAVPVNEVQYIRAKN